MTDLSGALTDSAAHNGDEKPPGPGLWLSIGLLTLGIILFAAGSWVAANRIGEFLFVESFDTPGSQVRVLDEGEYEIFGLVEQVDLSEFEVGNEFTLPTLDQITVTDVGSGTELVVTPRFPMEVVRNSFVFELAADFTLDQASTVEIEVRTQEESRAFVSRKIETGVNQSIPWLIAAVIGALLILLGALMLIIGAVRRRRFRRRQDETPAYSTAAPAPYAPPPVAPTHTPSAGEAATGPRLVPPIPASEPDLVTPDLAGQPIIDTPTVPAPPPPIDIGIVAPAVSPNIAPGPDSPEDLEIAGTPEFGQPSVEQFTVGAPDAPPAPNAGPTPEIFNLGEPLPVPSEDPPPTPNLGFAEPAPLPTPPEPISVEETPAVDTPDLDNEDPGSPDPDTPGAESPNEQAPRWRLEPTAAEEAVPGYEVEPRTFPSMAPSKPPSPPDSQYPAAEPDQPPLPPPT